MQFVYLIRHAATGETNRSVFPEVSGADEGAEGHQLDEGGVQSAQVLRTYLPKMATVWSSHAARTVQTARHALREPDERFGELAEADFGTWSGRVISDVNQENPEAVSRWMLDPGGGPPQGENFHNVQSRARRMLVRAAKLDEGPVAMVTHGGFIRAALCEVSGAPASAATAFGIPAASVTVLESDDQRTSWLVRVMGWQPALPWGSDSPSGVAVGR